MEFPKLVIATDGRRTAALLDGIFIGKGIMRLDFSSENEDGDMKSTIRILDLDVDSVELSTDPARFVEFMERLAEAQEQARQEYERLLNINKKAIAKSVVKDINDTMAEDSAAISQ